MAINLTDSLNAATTKGKLGDAKQVFLNGDAKNLQQAHEETNAHLGTLDNRSTQMEKAIQDISATGGASTANAVSYNNSTSKLEAVTAQGAIDEVNSKLIYDVSACNSGVVFESLQALLSSSNLSTLIPTSVRHGGMSIRFVQSSDNKYVQYRLMSATWSTTIADWQGVDDEPTAGSDNLVKSGGVVNKISELEAKQSNFSYEIGLSEEKSAGDIIKINTIKKGTTVSAKLLTNETGIAVNVYLVKDEQLSTYQNILGTSNVGTEITTVTNADYNYIRITSANIIGLKEVNVRVGEIAKDLKNIKESIGTNSLAITEATNEINSNANRISQNEKTITLINGILPLSVIVSNEEYDNATNRMGGASMWFEQFNKDFTVNNLKIKSPKIYKNFVLYKAKKIGNEIQITDKFEIGLLNSGDNLVAITFDIKSGELLGINSNNFLLYNTANITSSGIDGLIGIGDNLNDIGQTSQIAKNINGYLSIQFQYFESIKSKTEIEAEFATIDDSINNLDSEIKDLQGQVDVENSVNKLPFYIDFTTNDAVDENLFKSGYTISQKVTNGYKPIIGLDSVTVLKTRSCGDNIRFIANVSITAKDAVIAFGSVSKDSRKDATMGVIDFSNNTISLCGNTTGYNLDGANKLDKDISTIVSDSNSYIIEIGKRNRDKYISITNCISGERAELVAENDYRTYGFLYDNFAFGQLSGQQVFFEKIYVVAPNDLFSAIIGNSITQGASYRDYGICWAKKVADYLGNTSVFARHGGNIDDVIEIIYTLVRYAKPRYIIVTIGTNGGNTITKLNQLVKLIKSIGAIPIINYIYLTNEETRKDKIQGYNDQIKTLGVLGARFDIATAVNNDISLGADDSLFQSDLVHPNETGHEKIFQRFVSDVGIFIKKFTL